VSTSRALSLPKPATVKILEPEHLKSAAVVLEAHDKLPAKLSTDLDVLQTQEVMRRATALAEVVEAIRVAYKKPVDELAKAIQVQAKKVLDPMGDIIDTCKKRLGEKAIADKAADAFRAMQEMAEAEKDGRATPDLTRVSAPVSVFKPKIPLRETQVATVTDPSLLPDEYWKPDMDLINARALGPAAIAIPGVTISIVASAVNR
jgi:uncharacterized protein (DUF2344 family)